MDQPKIERILRMMQLLSGNVNYSVEELCDRFKISPRTFYRYIDTFKGAGFSVQRISEGVYKMTTLENGHFSDLHKVVYFTEEEATVVDRLIDDLDNTNAMKTGLKRKLAAVYDATNLAGYIDNKDNSISIGRVSEAIRSKKQMTLHQYSSSHSQAKKEYVIEPFRFNHNYIDFWGYDTADRTNKCFKISRIGEAEVLDSGWEYEKAHQALESDDFRIASASTWHISLKMDVLAKNLLLEEYPLTKDSLTLQQAGTWIYEADVHALEGIGRFVMGLSDHIEIVEGNELKEYIRRCAERILGKEYKNTQSQSN